mgnify:CR=1 FL=1
MTFEDKVIKEFGEKFTIESKDDDSRWLVSMGKALVGDIYLPEEIKLFLLSALSDQKKEIEDEYAGLVTDRKLEKVIQKRVEQAREEYKSQIISLGEGIRPKKVFSVLINREIFVSEGDDGYNKAIEDYKAKISELT